MFSSTSTGGSLQTILVVEDQAASLQALGEMLRSNRYRVLLASRPSRAIELAADGEEPIDLLLANLLLPGMRGDELATNLGRWYPQMRVIFMSGLPEALAGARRPFVRKPINMDRLVHLIEHELSGV